MNPFELDRQGELREAIRGYEEAINTHQIMPEIFSNLLVIYWNISFDYGANSHFLTSGIFNQKEIEEFNSRYKEVLKIGLEFFPDDCELKFWDRYISECVTFADHYSSNYFRGLMTKNANCRVPLFYIKSFSPSVSKEELESIENYRKELTEAPTYKNKYILSYLIQ